MAESRGMKTEEREQRLFQIQALLEREPDQWTCGKLAARFHISKKRIHDDIQRLRRIGFEIQGSYKGYRILYKKKSLSPGVNDL